MESASPPNIYLEGGEKKNAISAIKYGAASNPQTN